MMMLDNDAIFSPDGTYRYALQRRVLSDGVSLKTDRLLFVMLNPSVADAFTSDPTINKCKGFARHHGFLHIRVVNLFALVSTDYRRLAQVPDPVGVYTDAYIDSAAHWASPHYGGKVIAAWGRRSKIPKQHRTRPQQVLELLRKYHPEVYCLGKTKDGDPKHPLMLPYSTPLEVYRE